MKIVILEGAAVNPGDLSWDAIKQFGEVTIYDRTDPTDAAARIRDAQIILINKTPITAELLDQCPDLRLICVQATGYNVVDCDAARKRGITVCNVPAYGTNAVTQFTFSLLLEICNRVGHHDDAVHTGRWSTCGNFCFWDTPQMELYGKTLGIIGYGSIGQSVGRVAKAFGMKGRAYSRTQKPEFQDDYANLDTVLAQSDIITLHCPMTPETDRIINKDTIAKMKDGAILINTGRGQLVDEQAAADALVSGKLRAMAADVVSVEPITPDNPLLSAPNCILTPHMAWTPVEARQRIIDITVGNISGFLKGEIVNAVNL